MILKGRDLDLRVSLVPYATGEAITLRLFDKGGKLLGLEGQGLSDDNLDKLKRWIKSPNGTIIVTGPTDCGKTTLLYSMLQALNTLEVKITTVLSNIPCCRRVSMIIPTLSSIERTSALYNSFK